MNPYDIEQTEMHFNKAMGVFTCIVILFLICAGAYFSGYGDAMANKFDEVSTSSFDDVVTTEETTEVADIETIIETSETTEETDEPVVTETAEPYLILTESERLIFATLLRLECGGCSYECQMAAASVIVNRMDVWDKTLREAIFGKNAFSPSYLINPETGGSYYNPAKDGAYAICWQVVDEICANGPTLPRYVIYFRSKRYHSWATPYEKIGDLYFSYDEKYV